VRDRDLWYKSSFSGNGGCVEVKIDDLVRVRDSKDPSSPVLTFTHREWRAFLQGVGCGEFNLREEPGSQSGE
jgi:hypothetical protein